MPISITDISSVTQTTTPPKDSTKKLWGVVMWIAIGVISITMFAGKTVINSTIPSSPLTGTSDALTTKLITITPQTEWVVVETNGKEFESEILPVNGIKLKYFICINDISHPIEQPASKETKWGPAKNIQRVYYSLKANQEFNKAQILFKFK